MRHFAQGFEPLSQLCRKVITVIYESLPKSLVNGGEVR